MLYYGPDYPHHTTDLDWFILLSEQLQQHEIHLTIEKCTDARLRTMAERGVRPHEMILLHCAPAEYQKLFVAWKRAVMVSGSRAAGIDLPFFCADLDTLIRHATLTLLQRGHTNLSLIINQGNAPGSQNAERVFESECGKWKRSRVRAEVVWVPLHIESMATMVRQVIGRWEARHGR